jgi:hypothetical protein
VNSICCSPTRLGHALNCGVKSWADDFADAGQSTAAIGAFNGSIVNTVVYNVMNHIAVFSRSKAEPRRLG